MIQTNLLQGMGTYSLYPKWEKGLYSYGSEKYDRLEQIRKINCEAAETSARWRMSQIMRFNHTACDE